MQLYRNRMGPEFSILENSDQISLLKKHFLFKNILYPWHENISEYSLTFRKISKFLDVSFSQTFQIF